jgi:hypothetical protein
MISKKVAEEYSWVTTQALGWSRCGQLVPVHRSLDLNWTASLCIYLVDRMSAQLALDHLDCKYCVN